MHYSESMDACKRLFISAMLAGSCDKFVEICCDSLKPHLNWTWAVHLRHSSVRSIRGFTFFWLSHRGRWAYCANFPGPAEGLMSGRGNSTEQTEQWGVLEGQVASSWYWFVPVLNWLRWCMGFHDWLLISRVSSSQNINEASSSGSDSPHYSHLNWKQGESKGFLHDRVFVGGWVFEEQREKQLRPNHVCCCDRMHTSWFHRIFNNKTGCKE